MMRRILLNFRETYEYLRDDREKTVDIFAIVATTMLVAVFVMVFPVLLVIGTEFQNQTVPAILIAGFSTAVIIAFARVLGVVSEAREMYSMDEVAMKRREKRLREAAEAEVRKMKIAGERDVRLAKIEAMKDKEVAIMSMSKEVEMERARAHETILGVLKCAKEAEDRAAAAEKRAAYEQSRADLEKARANRLEFEIEKAKVLFPAAAEVGRRRGMAEMASAGNSGDVGFETTGADLVISAGSAKKTPKVNPAAFPKTRPTWGDELFEAARTAAEKTPSTTVKASAEKLEAPAKFNSAEALAKAIAFDSATRMPRWEAEVIVQKLSSWWAESTAKIVEEIDSVGERLDALEAVDSKYDFRETWKAIWRYWLFGRKKLPAKVEHDAAEVGEELTLTLAPAEAKRFCA